MRRLRCLVAKRLFCDGEQSRTGVCLISGQYQAMTFAQGLGSAEQTSSVPGSTLPRGTPRRSFNLSSESTRILQSLAKHQRLVPGLSCSPEVVLLPGEIADHGENHGAGVAGANI